jgi:hypothetical protein
LDIVAEMRERATVLEQASFLDTDRARALTHQRIAADIRQWADDIDYQTTAIAHHMEALFGVPKP